MSNMSETKQVVKEVTTAEHIEMMNRCKHELQQQRATIDRLAPKADAYDNLVAVLRLLPKPGLTMGEDLVWRLEKRIDELMPKPAPNDVN